MAACGVNAPTGQDKGSGSSQRLPCHKCQLQAVSCAAGLRLPAAGMSDAANQAVVLLLLSHVSAALQVQGDGGFACCVGVNRVMVSSEHV
jgi:hypothetical protein